MGNNVSNQETKKENCEILKNKDKDKEKDKQQKVFLEFYKSRRDNKFANLESAIGIK
jgi:hypothetical protein